MNDSQTSENDDVDKNEGQFAFVARMENIKVFSLLLKAISFKVRQPPGGGGGAKNLKKKKIAFQLKIYFIKSKQILISKLTFVFKFCYFQATSPKSRSATRSGSVSRPRRIQDPYPHYNQWGSATLVLNIENNLKRILFPFNHLLKIFGTSRIFNLGHDTKYF